MSPFDDYLFDDPVFSKFVNNEREERLPKPTRCICDTKKFDFVGILRSNF